MTKIDGIPVLLSGTIIIRSGEIVQVDGPPKMHFAEGALTGATQVLITPTDEGMDFALIGFAPGTKYIHRFGGSLASGKAYNGFLYADRIAELGTQGVYKLTYQIVAN